MIILKEWRDYHLTKINQTFLKSFQLNNSLLIQFFYDFFYNFFPEWTLPCQACRQMIATGISPEFQTRSSTPWEPPTFTEDGSQLHIQGICPKFGIEDLERYLLYSRKFHLIILLLLFQYYISKIHHHLLKLSVRLSRKQLS